MKKDTQADLVYQELRRRILIGQIEPNSRLTEDLWAKKLTVSRMAVREALTRLYGEGLVQSGEKGGYYLAEMKCEDVVHIRELREILELAAVKLAIDRITEMQLVELANLCQDFSTMVEKGYILGACEADIKFHETLVSFAGNPRLLTLYHKAHIPLFQQKIGKTKEYLDDYDLTTTEHLTLVTALRMKDLKLAEETLKQHFKRGELAVLDILGE